MGSDPPMISRRSVLRSAGVAASTGVAGCGAPDTDAEDAGDVEVAEPVVRSPASEPWDRIDARTGTYSMEQFGIGVTAHERTAIFRNARLEQRIRQETLGQFDSRIAMFFASHLDLRGVATIAASPDRLSGMLLPMVEEQMANSGIGEVQQVATASPIPSYPNSSTVVEYEGAFRTPRITKQVPIEDVGERTLSIPPDRLPMSGLVSVWKDDTGTAFAAGAVFPAGDFESSDTVSLTGGEGNGIDITISIDLRFSVGKLRQSVVEMMESVGVEEDGAE